MHKNFDKLKEFKGKKIKVAAIVVAVFVVIGIFGVMAIDGVSGDSKNDNKANLSEETQAEESINGKKDSENSQSSSEKKSSNESSSNGESKSDGSTDGSENPVPAQEQITVYVSATCKSILDNKADLSESLVRKAGNGYLVGVSVTITKGSTAMDASNAAGIYGLGGYVSSIKGIAEKEGGTKYPLSGWLYSVNGSRPNKSADKYILNDGDTISWGYTLDGRTGY